MKAFKPNRTLNSLAPPEIRKSTKDMAQTLAGVQVNEYT